MVISQFWVDDSAVRICLQPVVSSVRCYVIRIFEREMAKNSQNDQDEQ
jgi:hypothetical protein